MQLSEDAIKMGEHPTIGPMRIEVGQIRAAAAIPLTPDLLSQLLTEVRLTNRVLQSIHAHLTRPPWWRRLWERIKHVALSR